MSIEVFGAGVGRTGTMSLKGALEQLGFGPCYHMAEVTERPEHSSAWYRMGHGGPMEWSVFDGYRSCVDWPAARYWREIIAHYPEAKVILTLRDPESWFKSATDTIFARMSTVLPPDAPASRKTHRNMCRKIIMEDTFGGRFDDKAHVIDVFERHNAAVRAEVDPARLLVYQVKEGWDPLCRFLGVPVPSAPFPRLNDTDSFRVWVAEADEAAEAGDARDGVAPA